MKKITLKIFMLIVFSFVMSSSVLATTNYITPYFYFNYRDGNYYGYTYTIEYAIYNTSSWNTGLLALGSSNLPPYYSPNPPSPWPFTSGSTVGVDEPTILPYPAKCYRVLVAVQKNDIYNTTKYGWSDWTDLNGLTNGSLTINVAVF